jgi:hypothetical protein
MASWRKVITSGSDANLKNLTVSQSISATSITGSLLGSAQSAEIVVINSDTAPTSSLSGSLWFNTDNLTLYVYYIDPSGSSYWLPTYNAGIPVTSSYSISSSLAELAETASFATTASYITGGTLSSSWASSSISASYVQFQYNREYHVSVAGSDSTGDGTLLFPFRTISKALHSASSATQIVVHPGTYEENPTVSGSASNVTITATNAEIGGIVEISGSLTVNQFAASTKVVGLAINNIIHTGSQNLYLQNVTVRSGVSKTGNGYLEANKILCQSPATFNVTAAGTVVVQNSLLGVVTVNNASATVNLANNISMVTPTCTLGTLLIDGGVIFSTGNTTGAVFSGAGSAVVLSNLAAFTPSNTPARISLNAASGYSIQNVAYDKANSTLGVSLGNKSQFQHIEADAVTGSFIGNLTGTATTASYFNTSNLATTGSNNFTGAQTITGQVRIVSTDALQIGSGSGDEGGEIVLAKAITNTSLTGSGITIDSYQDRLRIFEQGGNARGVFIDLSKAPNGVSGELLYKASGFVDSGVDVTLGNLKARIASSGNRSLQISTVSGTYSVYGSSVYSYNGVGGVTINSGAALSVTTTPAYLASGYNFTVAGATDTWVIRDTSNTIAWRITMVIGSDYNNNMVSIERLV